ncbi:very short patch repair endonuclease [Actinoalloteichus caeruleus]|uniref:T/G mismatch-specific endonuclease n=1 Tax=Actinoalloteichus caeruleus DSM 43889 TaxID=1120930 RepID=A0ABT1JQA9_ACTCY|nr:very short patch repair endonuclease [Actinoalloteichus caeruleus]MCP2334562.1 T/G mismatch-specific endonuclease [Actinoalloteichus caeruleus DSM 43889]
MNLSSRAWKAAWPTARAYKPRRGVKPSAEQDRAAGGHHRRAVALGDGRFARASVSLRLAKGQRRIRAYLRWSEGGKTEERYIGEVDQATRSRNLADAWRLALDRGLVGEEPLPPQSKASSRSARAVMRANRRRDTGPEIALRSLLHKAGLRYRVDVCPLGTTRRRADIVFPRKRVAVFVDGCFWHGCPEHLRAARTNADAWAAKLEGNRVRDAETNRLLRDAGWSVIRVWEHEDPADAAERISRVVRAGETFESDRASE